MAYVDGFVAAVPTANKQSYLEHAREMSAVFREFGALQWVDCWGDDVPEGEVTSFPQAVQCREDETVCFSWIVWPSREVRVQAHARMNEDPRFHPDNMSMPFDGMRLIYGGFEILYEDRA